MAILGLIVGEYLGEILPKRPKFSLEAGALHLHDHQETGHKIMGVHEEQGRAEMVARLLAQPANDLHSAFDTVERPPVDSRRGRDRDGLRPRLLELGQSSRRRFPPRPPRGARPERSRHGAGRHRETAGDAWAARACRRRSTRPSAQTSRSPVRLGRERSTVLEPEGEFMGSVLPQPAQRPARRLVLSSRFTCCAGPPVVQRRSLR